MLFRLIYDEALAHASYLLGCQQTGEAIIVDPARDVDQYMNLAGAHGMRITATTETHIHADFLSGCAELARQCGAHVYISGEGGPDWQSNWVKEFSHTVLKDGDAFDLGGLRFRALHTPGHTPEHMIFEVTDRPASEDPLGLLTGDFMFVGAMGRPDLLESALGVKGARETSARELHDSAQRFMNLPDFLQIWPAHGSGSACGKALGAVPQSTVGYERRVNPSLKMAEDKNIFVKDILSGQPEPPAYFSRMKTTNRDGVPPLEVDLVEFLPPNQCQELDLDKVTIVDLRPWPHFKACHARNAHWSAPGNWFPASVGSYLEPDQPLVLLADPGQAEVYLRLLYRLGYDHVQGVITPQVFDEASESMDTCEALEMDPMELQQAIESGCTRVIDVRGADEYERGCIPGTTHVPYTRLALHLDKLPPVNDEPLLVHCQGGLRSAMAVSYLDRLGYKSVNIAGGYAAWAQLAHRQAHS